MAVTVIFVSILSEESVGIPVLVIPARSAFLKDVESDLDDIFNTNEFAEDATLIFESGITKTIQIIFDNETVQIDPETGAKLVSSDPIFSCKSSILHGITNKCKVRIRGKLYRIERHDPDGTGVSSVVLHRDKTV